MVKRIFANSVAYRTGDVSEKSFAGILDLEYCKPPYDACLYTIRSAYYEINKINFNPEDITVFLYWR
jgi:hypothetical protein